MSIWSSPSLGVWRIIGTLGTFALALTASPVFSQQYKDIKRLGTSNAISRPGPKNGDELKRVFERNRADYEKILRDAQWAGNADDIFRAIEAGSFSEAKYPVGHTFEWMAMRKNGVAQPSVPIRWAGADPFEAFEIRVESNGQLHRFLIPKACGNLALIASGPTEAQIREEQERARIQALTPTLRVQAPNQCTGANVTVDVSIPGGMPQGGTVKLSMTRPSGQRETLSATEAGGGYRWQGKLDDAGAYTFTAAVDSPLGSSREATERINLEPCQPTCNITLAPPPADPAPKKGKATIGIDTCSSAARAGALTSRSVKIHHAPVDGPEQLIETLSLDSECSSSYLLPEYGTYRFENTVTDDRGMSSTCQADYTLVKPETKLDPFFTVFGGNERRWRAGMTAAVAATASAEAIAQDEHFLHDRSAPLLGGTVGIAFPFADGGASLFTQGGVAVNLRDSENTSIFADVGINKNFEGGFFGGGVGIWDINNSDSRDGTIFVHGGININERLQWHIEGRLFMDMLDMIDNNYVYLTGIRYFWKR